MNRRQTTLAALLASSLALTACGGGDPLEDGAPATGGGEGEALIIGSANFPENVLLAEIYAAALGDAGVEVTTRLNIGNREAYMAGLEDGSIQLIPEYTGNLTLYLDETAEATESDAVYAELQEALPDNLTVLDMAEAQDKDAVVVTADTAEEFDLVSISDLQPHAPNMVLGGPAEWRDRFTGVPGLLEVYGLEFSSFKPLDAGSTLTVEALKNGQIDAGNIFTTDPAIAQNDFVVLEDPESLFAAQNVVPLIATDALTSQIEEALNVVSAGLTTENLTEMMVQVQDTDPAQVAREFVDGL
ncbi:ABC transporter substrate-binding protein [Ornithinimicrobium cryptoxanthini]|uniref:ABC transporter substrate-binding protein n=1 Tax=Ornithinimicrobium cryptoxanthini TaxID=2934161 RepID=A0ABY4YIH4_9MICO|nr:ABC transporter substrate-binding protein [Ornithinimicrobium cryptoxanthini]USQ76567.1 ABC transporter substrate-binding protein [Ornithinimicrobium cryptoxanthini]